MASVVPFIIFTDITQRTRSAYTKLLYQYVYQF